MICVVSMKQAYECEARNLIATMMGSRRNKITIVVDDDVDLYDMEKVLWAIATRSQPDEDVIIFPRLVVTAMDPSVRHVQGWLRVSASMRPSPLASHFRKWLRCPERTGCP